jgi:hypothetical protein
MAALNCLGAGGEVGPGVRRRWDESEHPRWPSGSGDRSGEFRDKNGGDWADRIGDTLGVSQPAGRYGSIATGQTAQCPACGRTVKVVGTSGKLSTHNASKGVRCTGSGGGTTGAQRAGGVAARRAKAPKGPKNPEIKAPPPPPVEIGAQHDHVYGAARERMRRWQDGAAAPGRVTRQNEKTRREWEIENVEREIKDLAVRLDYAQQRARTEIMADMRDAGEDPYSIQARIDWGWNDQVAFKARYEQQSMDDALEYLAALKAGGPVTATYGWSSYGSPRQWSARELDEMVSAGQYTAPREFDPAHPLDIYGDMLHIEDDTWFTYQALDTLEQAIPPLFHEIVAAHLADSRVSAAGIYVTGTKTLLDLDSLGFVLTGKPRGWGKGGKWADVSGVVSGHAVAGVANTSNSNPDRYVRTFGVREPNARAMGNPMAGQKPDPSAMAHEFGHLLDVAIGSKGSASAASTERLWRLVHGKVVREGGAYLSPYFKQKGDAGPEELWADAVAIWARGSDDPVLYLEGGAPGLGGTPMQWPTGKPSKVPGRADLRTITWRVQNLARQYDIPYDVAFEISDYFDRLHKELKSGKRKTRLQRQGR